MALRKTPIANSQHTRVLITTIYSRYVNIRHNISMKLSSIIIIIAFTFKVILFSLFSVFSPKYVLK